jgi:hypothetical protein
MHSEKMVTLDTYPVPLGVPLTGMLLLSLLPTFFPQGVILEREKDEKKKKKLKKWRYHNQQESFVNIRKQVLKTQQQKPQSLRSAGVGRKALHPPEMSPG